MGRPPRPEGTLSPAESRVIAMMARGYTIDQAATRMSVAPETVKTQLANIRRILGARNTTHAVTLALAFRHINMNDVMKGQPR